MGQLFGGQIILDKLFYEFPKEFDIESIEWCNPYSNYPFNDEQISVIDILLNMYDSIVYNKEISYGCINAGIDTYYNILLKLSSINNGETIKPNLDKINNYINKDLII